MKAITALEILRKEIGYRGKLKDIKKHRSIVEDYHKNGIMADLPDWFLRWDSYIFEIRTRLEAEQ